MMLPLETINRYFSHRDDWDEMLLAEYPQLKDAIRYLNYLRSIKPHRRGLLITRMMDVLETVRCRFLETIELSETESDCVEVLHDSR